MAQGFASISTDCKYERSRARYILQREGSSNSEGLRRLLQGQLGQIGMLCALSGHISPHLDLLGAHESHLNHGDAFHTAANDLTSLDGSHVVEETSRRVRIRAGATE